MHFTPETILFLGLAVAAVWYEQRRFKRLVRHVQELTKHVATLEVTRWSQAGVKSEDIDRLTIRQLEMD